MADPQDHPMTDGPDSEARLPLSEDEQKILALYDKLQEVRLEIAIINAQHSQQPGMDFTNYSLTRPSLQIYRSSGGCHRRASPEGTA